MPNNPALLKEQLNVGVWFIVVVVRDLTIILGTPAVICGRSASRLNMSASMVISINQLID